jgi:hypothetical protein
MITAELIKKLTDPRLPLNQRLPQPAAYELARYIGVLFRNEARLRETIESLDKSVDTLNSTLPDQNTCIRSCG